MNQLVVSPSVLSMDYSQMKEQMNCLNQSEAQWLHFDVMDGHFVPNLTFGPDLLKGFRKMTSMVLDVHLMVTDPEKYAIKFIEAGADMVSFHVEALDYDIERCIQLIHQIKEKGVQAGIVVKPKTDIKIIEPLLKEVDMVLIMTVEPGFGGQSFMEDMLSKIEWLNSYRKDQSLNYRIEVDGGINGQTYKLAVQAGSDTLVAGSYVFKGDICQNVASLLK